MIMCLVKGISSSVGTYTVKIEKGSVTNSNVTFVNGTFTISKAPLTITAKSYTRKQGESNPTFEVTYSGFKNNETFSVLTKKPTCSIKATSSSSPGTYDIVASGASATNYTITYKNGKLTVTERPQVSFSSRGISYSELFVYSINGLVIELIAILQLRIGSLDLECKCFYNLKCVQ